MPAITASVAKYIACRSRGITCVLIGSIARPSFSATCSSTAGFDIGESADRAADRARGDLGARGDEARAAPVEFGIGLRQLEPEGHRLGMDAVAAPDRGGVLVLLGAAPERGEQRVEILE